MGLPTCFNQVPLLSVVPRFRWAKRFSFEKIHSGDEALKTGVVRWFILWLNLHLYFLIYLTRLTILAVTNCHWSDASSLATSVEVLRATLSQEFMTGLASKRAAITRLARVLAENIRSSARIGRIFETRRRKNTIFHRFEFGKHDSDEWKTA